MNEHNLHDLGWRFMKRTARLTDVSKKRKVSDMLPCIYLEEGKKNISTKINQIFFLLLFHLFFEIMGFSYDKIYRNLLILGLLKDEKSNPKSWPQSDPSLQCVRKISGATFMIRL